MSFNYIEDLLSYIGTFSPEEKSSIPPQDRGILFSIIKQLSRSLSLTEKQGDLVIKIIKNIDFLYSKPDVKFIIDYPKYKSPFRIIDKSKVIDIIDIPSKSKKKYISIKYPFDVNITKALSSAGIRKEFNVDSRLHLTDLTIDNLIKVFRVGKEHEFEIDKKIYDFLEKIEKIKSNPHDFIPMLECDVDSNLYILNGNKSLYDFFEKEKNGNFLHDTFLGKILNLPLTDSVKLSLLSKKCDPITKKIINSEVGKNSFCLTTSSSFNLFNLTAFLKDIDNYPVLISLPDNEGTVKLLNQWLIALNKNDVKNKEVSFLFRSPKNKFLNETIKEKGINNLITDQTKIVFINHKIPKTLYKLGFKSNILILNENIFGHYTLQKLIDSSPLVLYYCANQPKLIGKKLIDL